VNNLFYTTSVTNNTLTLQEQEAVHCALVLRKKAGDIVYVIDGNGNKYKCGIDKLSKREVECTILHTETIAKSEFITIAIAPTKNRDRLEWMIEKLVEIGVERIVLMKTTHTERTRINMDRLVKKVISAVKQSLRFYMPEVIELDYAKVLQLDADNKYIAHCFVEKAKEVYQSNSETKQLILIGPEGDFTAAEVEQAIASGFLGLDLGKYRLRTETAAIVAVSRFQ